MPLNSVNMLVVGTGTAASPIGASGTLAITEAYLACGAHWGLIHSQVIRHIRQPGFPDGCPLGR